MALSSAVLLILAFPNFNQPWCAWIALVPWLFLLRHVSGRAAFWWSYLIGALFFLGSIWWLIHVTLLGWLVLCAYLALYFGVFGWLTQTMVDARRKTQASSLGSWVLCLVSLVAIPSVWVALEFLRSHLLSGFGWNLLGCSQTWWLPVIQVADVTGAWGVSFVVVMVNAVLAECIASRRLRAGMVMTAVGCVAAMWGYGLWRLQQPLPGSEPMRIAVVQGNIPQEQKWDESLKTSILDRYERLTRQAAAQAPQLIVWPEASVPGILGVDEEVTVRLASLVESIRIPLLVGAPMDRVEGRRRLLTNSAVLLNVDGTLGPRYDKLHLVPFGEFVPLSDVWPRLRDALPPIGDFVPGHDFTVFESVDSRRKTQDSRLGSWVLGLESPFSVLICFEDVFPDLARRFVLRGARFLLTITNDAWFGNTGAAYQHAQASTLRAVELRVPMVRAANTGWSGCIDAEGRWLTRVRAPTGQELFIEGVALCEVTVADEPGRGLYRRWGDWFAWLCLPGCLGCVSFAIMKH